MERHYAVQVTETWAGNVNFPSAWMKRDGVKSYLKASSVAIADGFVKVQLEDARSGTPIAFECSVPMPAVVCILHLAEQPIEKLLSLIE